MELNLTQLETYGKLESLDTKARFNFGMQGNLQFNQKNNGVGISTGRGGHTDVSIRLQTSEGSTFGRSTLKGYLTSNTTQPNKVNSG
jgi:hypothetical protein